MKKLLFAILLVVLVACAPATETYGVTKPADAGSTDGAQFVITVIIHQPYTVRIIDTFHKHVITKEAVEVWK